MDLLRKYFLAIELSKISVAKNLIEPLRYRFMQEIELTNDQVWAENQWLKLPANTLI